MDSTFARRYEVESTAELPGTNSLRHFFYPGASTTGGRDGVLLKVHPQKGEPWLGAFARGSIVRNGLNLVLPTPNPDVICVVSSGKGYFVNASDPHSWDAVRTSPIVDVRTIAERSLILFSDFTTLVAYGDGGLKWTSSIGASDLRIVSASPDQIAGTWYDPRRGADSNFIVNTSTGDLIGGSRAWE
jgi:hypothetical protein